MKKKLAELVVGDRVELSANDSNGHDFKFETFTICQIGKARDLFGSECIDLIFDKGRHERFSTPCPYNFDVHEELT